MIYTFDWHEKRGSLHPQAALKILHIDAKPGSFPGCVHRINTVVPLNSFVMLLTEYCNTQT